MGGGTSEVNEIDTKGRTLRARKSAGGCTGMQAARKEVCGEANWDTRIKGAEEHAKTTVVIWVSIQLLHYKGQGCREGEGREEKQHG